MKCPLKLILCAAFLTTLAGQASAQLDSAINLPNLLMPRFTNSVVKFKSGDRKTAILNYNTVDQEMLFLQKDHYMILADPHLIDTIYMANRAFIPVDKIFLEVIMSGPISLFIQHKSDAQPQGKTTGYGVTTQTLDNTYQRQIYGPNGTVNLKIPEEFKVVDATQYWIRKGESMEKFTNKRQFLKIFPDKSKELAQFIDKNSTSFKDISDIVKLMNYCNELYR